MEPNDDTVREIDGRRLPEAETVLPRQQERAFSPRQRVSADVYARVASLNVDQVRRFAAMSSDRRVAYDALEYTETAAGELRLIANLADERAKYPPAAPEAATRDGGEAIRSRIEARTAALLGGFADPATLPDVGKSWLSAIVPYDGNPFDVDRAYALGSFVAAVERSATRIAATDERQRGALAATLAATAEWVASRDVRWSRANQVPEPGVPARPLSAWSSTDLVRAAAADSQFNAAVFNDGGHLARLVRDAGVGLDGPDLRVEAREPAVERARTREIGISF